MNTHIIAEHVHHVMFTLFDARQVSFYSLDGSRALPQIFPTDTPVRPCVAIRSSGVLFVRPEKWPDLFFSDFTERVVLKLVNIRDLDLS